MLKLLDSFGNNSVDHESLRRAARADRTSERSNTVREAVRRSFRYSLKDPKCVLELKFGGSDDFTRANVLRALKDAFDGVKNGRLSLDGNSDENRKAE